MTKRYATALTLTLALFAVAGCKKKVPAPAIPKPADTKPVTQAAPPPPKPIITFSAEPSTIERGQCATLRWDVANATQVAINPGVGNVAANGTQRVCPTSSTTYTLSATGPGGAETATASLNVAPPPPAPVKDPPKPKLTLSEVLSSQLQDALFDYDKSEVREDARNVLTRNSEALKQIFRDYPDAVVNVEGHCDERGSAEYNLGLGDRRATASKEFLTQLGVAEDKLKTVSFGKERPVCTDANEGCYQRNRRAHFSAGQ
jgi:peptidoglycan-associated lipoprotein